MKIIDRERFHLRPFRFMPTSLTVVLIASLLATARPAVAQFGHSDIDFGLDGDKFITNKRVYESFFPTFGIAKQFTSNPGFAAESDGMGTIGARREVVYDVLDRLFLWDGTDFVSPDTEVRIRIDNNPPGSGSTYVDATSGEQIGSIDPNINRIGAASAGGEVHSHVNFFLESGEESPPSGAYGMKLALSTNSKEIVDSDPIFVVFNFGLDANQFEESLAVYQGLLDASGVVGDFNKSGELDVGDIDLLTDSILRNSTDPDFDLNADAQVDQDDRREWVEVLRATYFGDSDLDGEFNSGDLVAVFAAGKYEQDVSARWREGDWDGDGRFGTGDLVTAFADGGYEQGPRAISAVPEPNGILLLAFGALAALSYAKVRRRKTNRKTRRVPGIFHMDATSLASLLRGQHR